MHLQKCLTFGVHISSTFLFTSFLRAIMDIEKVDYERITTLKRHVQVPESYGSLTIYAENKQYYISDVEDVEEVYVVLMAYVKNRKEVM